MVVDLGNEGEKERWDGSTKSDASEPDTRKVVS